MILVMEPCMKGELHRAVFGYLTLHPGPQGLGAGSLELKRVANGHHRRSGTRFKSFCSMVRVLVRGFGHGAVHVRVVAPYRIWVPNAAPRPPRGSERAAWSLSVLPMVISDDRVPGLSSFA